MEGGWASLRPSKRYHWGILAVVQVIKQDQADHINLCKITMYNASCVNVAPNRSTCFNLHTTGQ